MQRIFSSAFVVAVALLAVTCGGGSSPTNPPPVPSPSVAPQPTPTPAASPEPTPTPAAQACNLAPGPVARLAIAPWKLLLEGGDDAERRVRALPGFDEVLCLDRNVNYRLDLAANQKNADNRECCWINNVVWRKSDPSGIVVAESSRHPEAFIYRYNITPRGRDATLTVEAELDGVRSFPWQSGSGYEQGPIRIITMSANQIARECTCIYEGNGVYRDARGGDCPKI